MLALVDDIIDLTFYISKLLCLSIEFLRLADIFNLASQLLDLLVLCLVVNSEVIVVLHELLKLLFKGVLV